ncbi:hypothetical protein ACJVC5_10525 [Peredibacter sp. HCB2-198]|uniref:hypothetical protein n=1 Tax=Peredibacter sp. HCB2-198 TaxID=3383025 RepID=UPI0038B5A242
MRYLALFLLIACSQTPPLKFKYTSSKRYLASLTREEVVVKRIEGELKHPQILATGMDSTFLIVKLFDDQGRLLTDVDPSDLTLSTSEDVEAKPFVLKQGVYKSEILPRVKSRNIRMRVDWQEKVVSKEIVLKTTIAPVKDELQLLNQHSFQHPRVGDGMNTNHPTDGFSIENSGDNRIVDATRNPYSQRVFNFDYPEQARQNLSLEVYDAPNDTVSHTMHSIFWFFPRKNVHLVEQRGSTIDVTLPNGEKMVFHKDSKEIIDGVFTEGPVDVSKDRFKRKYPDLKYQGRGVVLRVNARGQSPQLGQFENTKIDMEYGTVGSAEVLIMNGQTGQKCRRPKKDFWLPLDVNPIEFKFPTDEEFDVYLRNNCGFGLPKF